MSYLDNLESAKDADTRPEAGKGTRCSLRGACDTAAVLRGFLERLFDEAAIAGHRIRAKIYLAWLAGKGPVAALDVEKQSPILIPATQVPFCRRLLSLEGQKLRLEVRGRSLNFIPTPDGIVSEYDLMSGETVTEPVDLNSDPMALLSRWTAGETAPAPVAVPDLGAAEEQAG